MGIFNILLTFSSFTIPQIWLQMFGSQVSHLWAFKTPKTVATPSWLEQINDCATHNKIYNNKFNKVAVAWTVLCYTSIFKTWLFYSVIMIKALLSSLQTIIFHTSLFTSELSSHTDFESSRLSVVGDDRMETNQSFCS